jgi:hypothetical protein
MFWKGDGCDAGHFYHRKLMWLRYDKRNVHPQCKRCNTFEGGQAGRYSHFMAETYTKEVLDELEALSWKQDTRTPADRKDWLLDIEDEIDRY